MSTKPFCKIELGDSDTQSFLENPLIEKKPPTQNGQKELIRTLANIFYSSTSTSLVLFPLTNFSIRHRRDRAPPLRGLRWGGRLIFLDLLGRKES